MKDNMIADEKNKPAKILVVDDEDGVRRVVHNALKINNCLVKEVASGDEALEVIEDYRPDLVLLDYNMPGLTGLETLEIIKKKYKDIAVIFLTAQSGVVDIVRGLDAGADDYITKPFSVGELLARVRTHLRIRILSNQLEQANDKLKELIEIDDLTGLFNMRSIYQKIDLELDRARRTDSCVGAIMMDMDFFKRVNDENDHLFGSFVLSEIGRIIQENIRSIDFAARYGGDEFLIVLTDSSTEGITTFCQRLREKISEKPLTKDGAAITMTSSLGYAITSPGAENATAKMLVKAADKYLYQSKESGRDQTNGTCQQDNPELFV